MTRGTRPQLEPVYEHNIVHELTGITPYTADDITCACACMRVCVYVCVCMCVCVRVYVYT